MHILTLILRTAFDAPEVAAKSTNVNGLFSGKAMAKSNDALTTAPTP
jgi:hypothetical protein